MQKEEVRGWQAINIFIKNKLLILKLLTKVSEKPE